jgi:EspG family
MSTADLREIGSISLLDLDIISRFDGRDFLPYPFMFTQPSRFSWHDEYVEYARSVPDRFNNADLRRFKECAGSYANADIRVECHVQYIPADTPSVRVVAARRDQAGFLAKQRPDEDVIDVYELSAYLLAPAVAESVALAKPGRRSAIIIPEYAPLTNNAEASEDFTIRHTIERAPSATEVPRTEVTAFGTVQTHWRPTRHWGIDPGKNAAVWIRIKDDGDYLYQPDFSQAEPMSRPILVERIDRLISEDVKALRQFRNG